VRLASKILLASLLGLFVLLGAALLSLVAVNRLVDVNRAIVTRSTPALELELAAEESLLHLIHLESRAAVFRDPAYHALWAARAAAADEQLARLGALLTTARERRRHRKARAAFETYRQLAARRRPRGPRGPDATRIASARTQLCLLKLRAATRDALAAAQADARAVERRTWHVVGLSLAASLGLAVTAASLLAFRMTHALRRLSVATTEIERGTFRAVLPVRRADEIGALARSFTRMADRLGEADRMKEEFFSHISHELRTPLTSVREAVHLLRDRVAGPLEPKQARLVDIIGDGTERMLRLVNQILELTRLRAGLLAIDHRSVDVARLVARALEQLRPQAEARGVTLHQNGTPTAAVTGDEERLFQVALNLVGNAIKFTTTGGKVEVRVAERNGGVALTVEDDGVGIPADALPRIFEPYRQAHATGGGSGLGLAIVKGIVEAHGGRIEVASREGAGSRFTVTLPGREEA